MGVRLGQTSVTLEQLEQLRRLETANGVATPLTPEQLEALERLQRIRESGYELPHVEPEPVPVIPGEGVTVVPLPTAAAPGFFEQEIIAGVPNTWLLLAAAVAGYFLLRGK